MLLQPSSLTILLESNGLNLPIISFYMVTTISYVWFVICQVIITGSCYEDYSCSLIQYEVYLPCLFSFFAAEYFSICEPLDDLQNEVQFKFFAYLFLLVSDR